MEPDPKFVGVTQDGETLDAISALDEVAYDPTQMTVDLTKAEKRGTTALMLAIQAYQHLIIKDAKIHPATMNAMVEAAIDFDDFIAGRFEELRNTRQVPETTSGETQSPQGPEVSDVGQEPNL